MDERQLLALSGTEVDALLRGRERDVIQTIRQVYLEYERGQCVNPLAAFLRFPEQPRDRIIALPALIRHPQPVAGIKWIASFPANVQRGLDRASAVVVLNSTVTGRARAFLDGATISAQRTAASAALAAECLGPPDDNRPVGIIGCGRINREIVRFLPFVLRPGRLLLCYDSDRARTQSFVAALAGNGASKFGHAEACDSMDEVLKRSGLLSFATTAQEPHVDKWHLIGDRATVLHISLRDLPPEAVFAFDNVVDDLDHVFNQKTSLHLGERIRGNRDFVRTTLGSVLSGTVDARGSAPVVAFSPFGLGVLDIGLAARVVELAEAQGTGVMLEWR
jgi:ornithine cyclodeaminase